MPIAPAGGLFMSSHSQQSRFSAIIISVRPRSSGREISQWQRFTHCFGRTSRPPISPSTGQGGPSAQPRRVRRHRRRDRKGHEARAAGCGRLAVRFPRCAAPRSRARPTCRTCPPSRAIRSNFREIQQKMPRQDAGRAACSYRQMLMQANREAIGETAAWWMKRMATGPYPLQEKLTLFWHGHFTTSRRRTSGRAAHVDSRTSCCVATPPGTSASTSAQISRDPAMLDYLNNQQNRKAHPERKLRPRADGAVHPRHRQLHRGRHQARPPAPSPAGRTTATTSSSASTTTTTATRHSSARRAISTATTSSRSSCRHPACGAVHRRQAVRSSSRTKIPSRRSIESLGAAAARLEVGDAPGAADDLRRARRFTATARSARRSRARCSWSSARSGCSGWRCRDCRRLQGRAQRRWARSRSSRRTSKAGRAGGCGSTPARCSCVTTRPSGSPAAADIACRRADGGEGGNSRRGGGRAGRGNASTSPAGPRRHAAATSSITGSSA